MTEWIVLPIALAITGLILWSIFAAADRDAMATLTDEQLRLGLYRCHDPRFDAAEAAYWLPKIKAEMRRRGMEAGK